MPDLSRKAVQPLIRLALREDAARRDLTSQRVIPRDVHIRVKIIAKSKGVAAGVKMAALTFTTFDPSLRCRLHVRSGARVAAGTPLLTIEGRARSIFAAERTALNFFGHLSGIATLTRRYVERIRGTRARIFDTRKTLPGFRALEKYAVRAGGGQNHRADLSEAILIKTNHLKALRVRGSWIVDRGSLIARAVTQARRTPLRTFIEVEVTNLSEFQEALRARPHAILLDNWNLKNTRKAVALRNRRLWTMDRGLILEVSGGVTLANVRAIAKTGVDRISIGRLTHSAPSLDVSLQVL